MRRMIRLVFYFAIFEYWRGCIPTLFGHDGWLTLELRVTNSLLFAIEHGHLYIVDFPGKSGDLPSLC